MRVERFKWHPTIDTKGDVDFRVSRAQFGDGYAQVVGDGINTKKLDVKLTHVGRRKETEEIMNFFDRHRGYIPFEYKHPIYGLGIYVCEGYNHDPQSVDTHILKFTFKQAYV